jgi:uncharacterized protein DUF4235
MRKLTYRILAIVSTTVGVMSARKLTTKFRNRLEPDLDPTSREARWAPVLVAAALQAAIEGTIRAAAKRGTAATVAKVSGDWPVQPKEAASAAR